MIATSETWTTDRVERLKSCLDAGFSCAEIAREIGVTRNAVIGKISRLKLTRVKDAMSGRRERRLAPGLQRPRIVTQHQILMALRATPQPSPQEPAAGNGHRCSLLELGQEKCRWPINEPGADDFCFCGDQPVNGLPYCPAHARIAYHSAARARSARR
jgi:GcrA cell cycle regulator